MPSAGTTYNNKLIKLKKSDTEKQRYIVGIEPLIENKQFVHHMLFYHCEAAVDVEFPNFEGPNEDMPKELSVCSKVIAFWVSCQTYQSLVF